MGSDSARGQPHDNAVNATTATPYIRDLRKLDPERFSAEMRHVDIGGGLQISVIAWGGPVELETEPTQDRYVVTVPLAGQIEIHSASQTVRATVDRAVIADPDDETWQRWSDEAAAIWVQLPREEVEREAQHATRAQHRSITLPPRERIRFPHDLCLTRAQGRAWREVLDRLIALLDDYGAVAPIPPHRLKALRHQLITDLPQARHLR